MSQKPIFIPSFDLNFSNSKDINQQLKQFAQQIVSFVGAGQTSVTRVGAGTPAPLPTDANGDTYWDSLDNNWYIFSAGAWTQLTVGMVVDYTTGIISNKETGAILGYVYKYLHIAYSTVPNGTLSGVPAGQSYYGLANNNSTATPTNPTDYIWYPGSFGTTNYLYYNSSGGRHISFEIADSSSTAGTSAGTNPDFWQRSPTGYIDLDQVTGSGAMSVLSASISPTPASTTGFTNPQPNTWLVPPSVTANNISTWTASTITVSCTNYYPNNNTTVVQQSITLNSSGQLSAVANTSADTQITISGNNSAAMQVTFSNQLGVVSAYVYAGNSAITTGAYHSFDYEYLYFAFADSINPTAMYTTPTGHRYIGLFNWPTSSASTATISDYKWFDLGAPISSTNILWANWNNGVRTIVLETGSSAPDIPNFSNLITYQAQYGNIINLDSVSGFVVTGGNTSGGNYSTTPTVSSSTLFFNLPYLLDFGGSDTTSISNLTSIVIDRQGRIKAATQLDLLYSGNNSSAYGSGPFTFNHVYGQCLIYRNGLLLPTTDYTEANPSVTSSGRTVASVASNVVTFTGGDAQPFYTSDILQFGSSTTTYIVTSRNIAQIIGSISSSVLSATSITAGAITVGMNIYNSGTIVGTVTGQTSGTTGGVGTYSLSGATNTASTTLHCTDQKLTLNASPSVTAGTVINNASGSATVTIPSAASTDIIVGWKFTESTASGTFAYVPFTREEILVSNGVTLYTPSTSSNWIPGNEILYLNGVELNNADYSYTTDSSGNPTIQLAFVPTVYAGITQYLTLVAFRKLSGSSVPFTQGTGTTVGGSITVSTGSPLQQTNYTMVTMNGLILQPTTEYTTTQNNSNVQLGFTPTAFNSVMATAFSSSGNLIVSNSGVGSDSVKIPLEPGMLLANDNILVSLGSEDPSSDGIFPIIKLPKSTNERFDELEDNIYELTEIVKSLTQEIKTLKDTDNVNSK